ncbi:MAG: hypothetical protein JWP74_2440 [Marmoricola sp.]|nr:hypothetical protein [Marmoricola sp.]
MQRVNLWLRDRSTDTDVLPLRERSLEVLGNEKALDRLLTTGVFAEGRLTLKHLRTFRTHPPLASVKLGNGPVLLVVENDDTFFSIREVLTRLAHGPGLVGYVAWGSGGAFEASVRTCGDLPGVERVSYFGDLDADGFRIPTSAAETAAREGLPPVSPTTRLYESLLATGAHIPGQVPVAPEQAKTLTRWLSGSSCGQEAEDSGTLIAERAAELLVAGIRIPQEAVNLTLLTQLTADPDTTWLANL